MRVHAALVMGLLAACGPPPPAPVAFDATLLPASHPLEADSLLRVLGDFTLYEMHKLAVSHGSVFFTMPGHGVFELPWMGSAVERVDGPTSFPAYENVAADDNAVYWSLLREDDHGGPITTLLRRAVAGGTITTLTTGAFTIPSSNTRLDLQSDGTDLYFTIIDAIARLPGAGGSPQMLVTADEQAWVVDRATVFMTNDLLPNAAQSLRAVDASGGPVQTLADLSPFAHVAAVDATDVYVTSAPGLLKIPRAGGAPIVLYQNAPTENLHWWVQVDVRGVYFITLGELGQNQVRFLPTRAGGPVTTLGAGAQFNNIWQMAQDERYLYFIASAGQEVLRLAKY
jgi:hypothetical protein